MYLSNLKNNELIINEVNILNLPNKLIDTIKVYYKIS